LFICCAMFSGDIFRLFFFVVVVLEIFVALFMLDSQSLMSSIRYPHTSSIDSKRKREIIRVHF
jgi:hypothetical protein